MAWWEGWTSKAQEWIYVEIPSEQSASGQPRRPLQPKSEYVRIYLKSWRIDSIREGWSRFFGAVHGAVTVARYGEEAVTVDAFTSPNELQNADPRHANRILSLNFPLFGPAPYMGGDLSLKIGLFSIKSADLAGPFLEMVTALAAAGGVPVAAAQPFVEPLRKGIEAITGTDQQARLEIGLVKSFSRPATGDYAVIRAEAGQIDPAQLRVDSNGHLVYAADGHSVQDYPYFVFSMESSEQHETWWEIPALAAAYAELTALVSDENASDALVQSAYQRFRRRVKLLPDLIPADMDRILGEVRSRIADARGVEVQEVGKLATRLGARMQAAQDTESARGGMPELKELQIYA